MSSRSARTSSTGRPARVRQVPVHVALPGQAPGTRPRRSPSSRPPPPTRRRPARSLAAGGRRDRRPAPASPRRPPDARRAPAASRPSAPRRPSRSYSACAICDRPALPMQTKYARGRPLTRPPARRARQARTRARPTASGHQPVVDPRPALARDLDEPGLAQHFQVVRDRRLGQAERADEVADADLVRAGQPVDDRHAARVGQRLEPRRAAPARRRPSSGGDPGQQHGACRTCSFLFIDDHQYNHRKEDAMYACDCDCCGGGCCC